VKEHHRQQLEYLFHLLDDEDLEDAKLVLTGRYERRSGPSRAHYINERRRDPLALTLRLKIILVVCMAAVSIVSVMLVRIVPAALFIIPIFFVYCAAIVVVRARMKLERI
jgi:hypothetical protein